MEVMIAVIYATIVAMSYRKVGFFPALIWPMTVILTGIMVYLSIMLAPDPDDNNKSDLF